MPIDKLSLLIRSKEYMESLAAGTDPVSGQALSREDPMGSERMQRCFAFVASVLDEVIAQRESGAQPAQDPEEKPKKEKKKRAEKAEFSITAEQLEEMEVTEKPANLTEMALRLNAAAGLEKSDLTSRRLSEGLEAMGFLETREGADGKKHRLPTAEGLEIGFERIRRMNNGGQPYMLNVLNEEGQRFIRDNLQGILTRCPDK